MKSILTLTLLLSSLIAHADLTLYSDRPSAINQIIAQNFKSSTGVNLAVVEIKYPQILAQLQAGTSNADVILVKDAVYLNELTQKGFFQAYNTALAQSVAPQMKTNLWTAITYRARSVIYNKLSVQANELKSFKDLMDPKWAGRLCLNSSQASYNQALAANFVADFGKEQSQQIFAAWVKNLAMDPVDEDETLVDAVASGSCEVAVVNSYYVARALTADPQIPVELVFVGQKEKGTPTNGVGVGISAQSKQVDLANKLIEIALSENVQKNIVSITKDFPANQNVISPVPAVASWTGFKINSTPWPQLQSFMLDGQNSMKAAGYK